MEFPSAVLGEKYVFGIGNEETGSYVLALDSTDETVTSRYRINAELRGV